MIWWEFPKQSNIKNNKVKHCVLTYIVFEWNIFFDSLFSVLLHRSHGSHLVPRRYLCRSSKWFHPLWWLFWSRSSWSLRWCAIVARELIPLGMWVNLGKDSCRFKEGSEHFINSWDLDNIRHEVLLLCALLTDMNLAFSSQALHPTHQTHSWPLQALSRRLRSSQQRRPSLFLSLWNIHPLAMIWTRLWTPGLPFRTLSYKVRLKPDSQRLKPETSFAARLDILLRPCEASCCAWWVPLSLWWHRRSKFWLEGCVSPNFRILIEIHWFPTQLFERVVFFCSKRKPGRGILYQNPKRGRSLLVCHGPGKHCIRHASK